jgi:hypothetical protein
MNGHDVLTLDNLLFRNEFVVVGLGQNRREFFGVDQFAVDEILLPNVAGIFSLANNTCCIPYMFLSCAIIARGDSGVTTYISENLPYST